MTRGQRLIAAIALAAAILLVGRAGAVMYVQQEWFASLGAQSVWHAWLVNASWMYGVALLIGTAFAWINISAVRRSVVALIVPKRLGNMEFGEEIPSVRLRWITLAVSLAAAGASILALPSWTTLAVWRSGVIFGESDAYLGLDLSHFVAWLPLETGVYEWCVALFAIVAVLVVVLYALTPSLSWGKHGLRVATYARRHITVLGAILLLLAAWGFRLDAFRLLIKGSGPDGLFTSSDYMWLMPAELAMSLVSVGAAVVLLAAGWMGQTVTAFVTVSAIILGALATQLLGPAVSNRIATLPENAQMEAPFRDTRDVYTVRAFPPEPVPLSRRVAADSMLLVNAGRVEVRGAMPDVVFPGAIGGAEVLSDPNHVLVAPRLGSGFVRLMHAWAEQNPQLLASDIPASAAYLRERDVRARITDLAPIFAQSAPIGAIPTAHGVLWILDLYATSDMYPLSAPRQVGHERITYSHHAATAYVSGGTGATVIVPDSAQGPIERAWFAAHPGRYIADRLPPALAIPPAASPTAANSPERRDTVFRAEVARIYERMRAALSSGNLKDFGAAFDSLGTVLRAAH